MEKKFLGRFGSEVLTEFLQFENIQSSYAIPGMYTSYFIINR